MIGLANDERCFIIIKYKKNLLVYIDV